MAWGMEYMLFTQVLEVTEPQLRYAGCYVSCVTLQDVVLSAASHGLCRAWLWGAALIAGFPLAGRQPQRLLGDLPGAG